MDEFIQCYISFLQLIPHCAIITSALAVMLATVAFVQHI